MAGTDTLESRSREKKPTGRSRGHGRRQNSRRKENEDARSRDDQTNKHPFLGSRFYGLSAVKRKGASVKECLFVLFWAKAVGPARSWACADKKPKNGLGLRGGTTRSLYVASNITIIFSIIFRFKGAKQTTIAGNKVYQKKEKISGEEVKQTFQVGKRSVILVSRAADTYSRCVSFGGCFREEVFVNSPEQPLPRTISSGHLGDEQEAGGEVSLCQLCRQGFGHAARQEGQDQYRILPILRKEGEQICPELRDAQGQESGGRFGRPLCPISNTVPDIVLG